MYITCILYMYITCILHVQLHVRSYTSLLHTLLHRNQKYKNLFETAETWTCKNRLDSVFRLGPLKHQASLIYYMFDHIQRSYIPSSTEIKSIKIFLKLPKREHVKRLDSVFRLGPLKHQASLIYSLKMRIYTYLHVETFSLFRYRREPRSAVANGTQSLILY